MADPPSTPAFPFRFAEAMPASVRDAVLQWWPITGAGSRVKPWEWIRPNTAAPEAEIYGDGHDSFPPNFSDWNEILGRICASEDVAKAAAQFEPNASALPLPDKEKDVMSEPKAKGKKDVRGKPKAKDEKHKLRAKHIDSPQVPNELRYDHELRKLNSKYRLYD